MSDVLQRPIPDPLISDLPPPSERLGLAAAGRVWGVDPATVWRKIKKGASRPDGTRDYLEAWFCCGRWFTTRVAILAFVQRQTEARRPGADTASSPRSPAARRRADAAAARKLDRRGIR